MPAKQDQDAKLQEESAKTAKEERIENIGEALDPDAPRGSSIQKPGIPSDQPGGTYTPEDKAAEHAKKEEAKK